MVRPAVLALAAGLSVPVQAADTPPPLAIYGRLPGFEEAKISASGQHTAILGTMNGQRMVMILDAERRMVAQLPLGTLKVRSVNWAGDQALLVNYSKTVGLDIEFTTDRTELVSTIVVPIGGGKPWVVFADKSMITGGVWGFYGIVQRDGRWFGYFGGITMERGSIPGERVLRDGRIVPDLYEVDLASRGARRIASRPDDDLVDRHWLIDGTGSVGAVLDYNRNNGKWRVEGAGRRLLASGTDPSNKPWLIGFTPDGASVIYGLRDGKAQRDDWYSVPLAGGTPQPYLAETVIAESFIGAGNRLIGYIDGKAESTAHFFVPQQDKIYAAARKAFPAQHMSLVDFNDSFKRLIVKTEGGGDPIVWWQVDIDTGHAEVLGQSYPLAADQVAAFRNVPYKAADGLAMEGVLTLPPGRPARALPVVILPHGGPTAHDSPGFDWIAQAFASRGYAVFQPNFRGSDGFGVEFEQAGRGEWGRKMQSDLSDGLAELGRQGIVDPHRACIVGASYGGYAALAGVTLQQGIYRCAVSIAGISDLSRMVSTEVAESGGDPMVVRELRAEIGTGRDLRSVSPIRFVQDVKVPIMLIHGKDDTVVRPVQSSTMASALRSAGKAVDYVTLPGEDHWLSTGETRQAMLEAAVGFVMRHNPP